MRSNLAVPFCGEAPGAANGRWVSNFKTSIHQVFPVLRRRSGTVASAAMHATKAISTFSFNIDNQIGISCRISSNPWKTS